MNNTQLDTHKNAHITDIMFDFCGVLLQWDCYTCLARQFPTLVKQICPEARAIFGAHDPCGFYEFEDRLDAGELLDDVMDEYSQRFGKQLSDAFDWYITHYDQVITGYMPGMLDLLRTLTDHGYRLWGLTNWSSETLPTTIRKFPELQQYLRATIVSGVEHVHKPQEAIYKLACQRFKLQPDQTVFFDDKTENIRAAQSLGFHGFIFSDAKKARQDLISLGVRL